MNTIGKLIELALQQCCERGVIDWYPGEPEQPESFYAECEIDYSNHALPGTNGNPDFFVMMEVGNEAVFCIVDAEWLECWHSSKLEVLA